MIARPPHERKLGLTGIALTQQRNNRYSIPALTAVRDEVEKLLKDNGFLEGVPFSWVTIAIRFGLKNDEVPTCEPINKRYGDLPLAIEIDSRELGEKRLDELIVIFQRAVLKALIHAGIKFSKPIDYLKDNLDKQ
jgi:hypothetical protein